MSFHDVVRSWTEDRLLFLDKVGSGRVRHLLLADCGDDAVAAAADPAAAVAADHVADDAIDDDAVDDGAIPSFRVHEEQVEQLRHVYDYAACVLGNSLYITGGYSVPKMEHLSRTLKYDPTLQCWSSVQPMLKARSKHAMVTYEGRLLVTGGETAGGKISPSCESYDPMADEWEQFRQLPSPRCWLSCCVAEASVYISGGYNGGWGKDDFWKYDAATRRWHDVGNLYAARLPHLLDRHSMFALGKVIYIAGGVKYLPKLQQNLESNEAQAAKIETQSAAYCLDLRRLEHLEASINNDSVEGERKMPNSTLWRQLNDMTYARHSAGHIILGNKVLVFGGTNAEFKCDVHPNELFDPALEDWSDEASLATDSIGSLTCVRLKVTHTRLIQKGLPKTWPLW